MSHRLLFHHTRLLLVVLVIGALLWASTKITNGYLPGWATLWGSRAYLLSAGIAALHLLALGAITGVFYLLQKRHRRQ